ncbi:MAG: Ig-like domain-containing protein, partial [Peptostreptococcaceae bacterium]
MIKRAHIYKKVSVIMFSAMIAGTMPISIFAQNNQSNNTVQEQSISNEKSTKAYIQNYDQPEGITWTHVKDSGSTQVSNGFLNVTNQGDYRLIEDQSMSLEDGEIEFRFQASNEHTGRFGAIFRALGDNHGVVAYNDNGEWTIEDNKGNWKTFKGPVLEAQDWATVRVMFVGNHITVKILDEATKEFKTYFDEVVDFIPVQEGKAGYRSWWNTKTTSVDYLKYGPVGSLDDGETPEIIIASIDPIKVSTFRKLKPELPKRVKVKYNNGATGNANVAWDYIEPSKYA